ncbi:MAG: xanthine dehydrogenase family protein subunit M [Clostridia bacterium]|nr:xanthine dehydrogenase family protein subunit M [Clostridia bacterium]
MKSAAFAYHRVRSAEEARDCLARYGGEAKVLAGGQSLVPMLHMRLVRPAALVDINRAEGLDRVEFPPEEDVVVIGAAVRHADVLRHAALGRRLPILREALALVGHPAIRNRGTPVGSVCHADPAAEMPAVLALLGGEVEALGAEGRYRIPADAFFLTYFTTALPPEDVAVAVRLPLPSPHTGQAFAEVARREGDFALVGAGASVRLDEDGRVAEARLVFCGVGDTPVRAYEVEAELAGVRPSAGTWEEAGAAAADRLQPEGDVHASAAYRREVAARLAARVLAAAFRRAREGPDAAEVAGPNAADGGASPAGRNDAPDHRGGLPE